MKICLRAIAACGACAVVWLAGSPVHAQEPAEGIMKQDAATAGSTDVAAEGFQSATVEAPEEAKDATELKISAGGMFTSGNSRLIAATSAGRFRARREDNQLSVALAGNYSRSAPGPEEDMETTVENVQGNTRYDRFVGEGFALFLSLSARNDRFQGLDLRLNLDPGVAYYFVDLEKVQLWTELGYDLQYDVRRGENIRAARSEGVELDRTEVRHSGRLFGGYSNAVSATITFNTGLEYLQGIQEAEYWRLNWDVGLSSAINSTLSIATTFSLRYDNAPLPDVEKTDTVTAVSLVYQLL
jgi:putative salt-induced outer membrane protein YdiY